MAESYPNGLITLWEKEKLLITSNFSFFHSVFKRLISQGCQKVLLCGNGLTHYHTILTFNAPEKQAFLKTLWEKEKMLVPSISSFSHNIIYLSRYKFQFFSHFHSCLQMLSIWTSLKVDKFLLFPQCFPSYEILGSWNKWLKGKGLKDNKVLERPNLKDAAGNRFDVAKSHVTFTFFFGIVWTRANNPYEWLVIPPKLLNYCTFPD